MNKNVIIVLAGGFLIAVLVAVLVQASLKGSGGSGGETTAVTSNVLVAARDLPVGHKLAEGDLVWTSWPQSSVFSNAIVQEGEESPMDVADGRLRNALGKGQPMMLSSLVEGGKGNFMSASLRPGMRAVGISVKAHTMAGGFVGPGDYVDVIVTHKVKVRDRDNPMVQQTVSQHATETILENVRVLAVDQQAKRDEDKAKVARTVTLEVDTESAEKLALATEMGDIRLALRGLGDERKAPEHKITTDVQVSRVLQDLAIMQGSSAQSGIVRIYNGDSVQNITVRRAYNGPVQ